MWQGSVRRTLDEGIIEKVIDCGPLMRVFVEAFLDELLAVGTNVVPFIRVKWDIVFNDVFLCAFVCCVNERRDIINDVIGKYSDRPHVYLWVANFALEDFWRNELKIWSVGLNFGVRKAWWIIEALHFESKVILVFAGEHNIGRAKISVNDLFRMKLFDHVDNLRYNFSALFFGDSPMVFFSKFKVSTL